MLCVAAVLRLGRAALLLPPAHRSPHLQLIQGQSSPPGISFNSRVHSSNPRLECDNTGSFRQVSPGWCGSCFSPLCGSSSRLVCPLHPPSVLSRCNQLRSRTVSHINSPTRFCVSPSAFSRSGHQSAYTVTRRLFALSLS